MNTRLLVAGAGLTALTALFSCNKQPGGVGERAEGKLVYVLSNDYHDNANAVWAYKKKADGSLEALPGSPFYTQGAGAGNPKEVLGPDDIDDAMIISPDGQYLLAVNGGSNTVAVFTIGSNGRLSPVPGSPFPSGGQTPCSIAINGRFVYVANKAFDPLHTITQLPNYVTFTIDGSGHLEQVPGGKVEVPAGSAPSQVLVSNDHRFLFATDFLAFMLQGKEPVGTLLSFELEYTGSLKYAPGSPYVLPSGDGGALGLAVNPHSQTLYVGFPVASSVGAYSIDPYTGKLTLQNTVKAGAAACWLRTNKAGTRLYVLNSGADAVQVFSTESPNAPVSLGTLVLKEPGTTFAVGETGTATSSGDFALNLSPDEQTLYVVSQPTDPNFGDGNSNWLHVLKVAADGTVSEPTEPLKLPFGADVRSTAVVTQ